MTYENLEYTIQNINNFEPWTLFFWSGGLPQDFFATVDPSSVGVSFLFLTISLVIGDDKFAWFMGLGGNDALVDATNLDKLKNSYELY